MFLLPTTGFFSGSSVIAPSWTTDSYDYFLTQSWITSSGSGDSGTVQQWNGEKGYMTTTSVIPDTVRSGLGSFRRTIFPSGSVRMQQHPGGSVGVVFIYKRVSSIPSILFFPEDGGLRPDVELFAGQSVGINQYSVPESCGDSPALIAEASAPYQWHAIGMKYNTNIAEIPKVWVDGILCTDNKVVTALRLPKFVYFGSYPYTQYSEWELGDFAVYTDPSDDNMAVWSRQLADRWPNIS